jgi:hypothetical protein
MLDASVVNEWLINEDRHRLERHYLEETERPIL